MVIFTTPSCLAVHATPSCLAVHAIPSCLVDHATPSCLSDHTTSIKLRHNTIQAVLAGVSSISCQSWVHAGLAWLGHLRSWLISVPLSMLSWLVWTSFLVTAGSMLAWPGGDTVKPWLTFNHGSSYVQGGHAYFFGIFNFKSYVIGSISVNIGLSFKCLTCKLIRRKFPVHLAGQIGASMHTRPLARARARTRVFTRIY